MLGWGKCLLLACAGALLLSSNASAQGICTTGTDPNEGTPVYQCSYATELAGEELSVDCRQDPSRIPQDPAMVSGCRVVAGTGSLDVARCEETSQPGSASETCRTMAWGKTGYTCRRDTTSGGDGQHFGAHIRTTCEARAGRNNANVTSRCVEDLYYGYQYYQFDDGCRTTVTTPLARFTCIHDPGVALAVFFGPLALTNTTDPAVDDEPDTPSCRRELLIL